MKQVILGWIFMCALLALASNAQQRAAGPRGGFWGYSANDYDDGWPPDFSSTGTQPAPAPVILVMPQMAAPVVAPPPPEPVRAVVREYSWPDSGGKPRVPFSIVSKDGTVRFALAVWVQTGVLHFTAPDRTAGQIALSAVDRRATAQLNAENRLHLPLP